MSEREALRIMAQFPDITNSPSLFVVRMAANGTHLAASCACDVDEMTFVHPGNGEHVKSAVHGALFTLASMCAIYNGCAWVRRREWHLAANSAIYTVIAAYETYQVVHHVEQSR